MIYTHQTDSYYYYTIVSTRCNNTSTNRNHTLIAPLQCVRAHSVKRIYGICNWMIHFLPLFRLNLHFDCLHLNFTFQFARLNLTFVWHQITKLWMQCLHPAVPLTANCKTAQNECNWEWQSWNNHDFRVARSYHEYEQCDQGSIRINSIRAIHFSI